jgi:hypothetical protein
MPISSAIFGEIFSGWALRPERKRAIKTVLAAEVEKGFPGLAE